MTERGTSRDDQSARAAERMKSARREILGDETLLTVNEVADLVGVSERQIYAMIERGTFKPPLKIGKLSRWTLGTVKNWIGQLSPKIDDQIPAPAPARLAETCGPGVANGCQAAVGDCGSH